MLVDPGEGYLCSENSHFKIKKEGFTLGRLIILSDRGTLSLTNRHSKEYTTGGVNVHLKKKP